jgi:hypothetical protein
MQKKIQITSWGVASIYHKAALQFVLGWKEPMRVHENWIQSIENVAADVRDVLMHTRRMAKKAEAKSVGCPN